MYFSPALIAAFAGLVYGANTAGTTQTVLVAQNNGLTFSPNTVTAAAGSKIAFQFTNGNHTVTAGTLAQACTPGGAGFASGFVPVNQNPTNPPTIQGTLQGNAFVNNGQLNQGNGGNGKNNKRSDFQVRGMNGIWGRAANGQPTFTVTVANTQPQPVYCNQQLHCQQGPMVMIINGNAQQLAAYQASAKQANQNVIANGPTGGTLTGNVQQTTNNGNTGNQGNQAAQQAQQAQQAAQQQQAQQAAQQAQQAQQQAQQQQQQAAQQQQQAQQAQQAAQQAQQAKNNN